MRIARMVGVAVALVAVAAAPFAAHADGPAPPPVTIESAPGPDGLPDNFRQVTVKLAFGDATPDEGEESPYPFSFVLEMTTYDFRIAGLDMTPGLDCEPTGWAFTCTVEAPGEYVLTVSGPEGSPTVGCTRWAQVVDLDGEVLAQLGDAEWACIGWPLPLPEPEPEPEIDESLSPVPAPGGPDTLPPTGTATVPLVAVAGSLLALGVVMWLTGRRASSIPRSTPVRT